MKLKLSQIKKSIVLFFEEHKGLIGIMSITVAVAVSVLIFSFRREVANIGKYGYLGIFFLSMLGNATVLLPMPTFLSAFVGGSVLRPMIVGLVAAGGGALGEITGYMAGYGGNALITERKTFNRIQEGMRRFGLFSVFILAAIPNPFFDMVGIAAGVMRLPIFKFLLVTFLGQSIKFLLISYLGAGSADLFERMIR